MMSTETYWESIRESATTRVVLPEGEEDLERAASGFVATLTADHWLQLDQTFHEQVLSVRGGLFQACSTTSDLARHLVSPLLTHASNCLGQYLPVTDVAEVELSKAEAVPGEMAYRIRADHENAVPMSSGSPMATSSGRSSASNRALSQADLAATSHERSFLLVPASDSGKAYGAEAVKALPHLDLVTVPGQADLMFCREHDRLGEEEMDRILRPCRAAYDDVANAPPVSPHARFDIHDWMPIDP
jgi:hypothetical protein